MRNEKCFKKLQIDGLSIWKCSNIKHEGQEIFWTFKMLQYKEEDYLLKMNPPQQIQIVEALCVVQKIYNLMPFN